MGEYAGEKPFIFLFVGLGCVRKEWQGLFFSFNEC